MADEHQTLREIEVARAIARGLKLIFRQDCAVGFIDSDDGRIACFDYQTKGNRNYRVYVVEQ